MSKAYLTRLYIHFGVAYMSVGHESCIRQAIGELRKYSRQSSRHMMEEKSKRIRLEYPVPMLFLLYMNACFISSDNRRLLNPFTYLIVSKVGPLSNILQYADVRSPPTVLRRTCVLRMVQSRVSPIRSLCLHLAHS